MIQPKRLGAILAAPLLVGCAGDPDSDLGAGVQGVEVVGVNTLDMAEYMFPSCEVGQRGGGSLEGCQRADANVRRWGRFHFAHWALNEAAARQASPRRASS